MLWYVGRFLATYKLNWKVELIAHAHAKEEPTIKPWNDPYYSYSLNSIIGFFLFSFGDMDMQLRKKRNHWRLQTGT